MLLYFASQNCYKFVALPLAHAWVFRAATRISTASIGDHIASDARRWPKPTLCVSANCKTTAFVISVAMVITSFVQHIIMRVYARMAYKI